jgi:hypothetical protein
MQKIFIKKCFLFMVGSVFHVKWFTSGSGNVANVSLMMKRLKWRCKSGREKSKDCYAVGFDALVKRWDMCINVGGGYVDN